MNALLAIPVGILGFVIGLIEGSVTLVISLLSNPWILGAIGASAIGWILGGL